MDKQKTMFDYIGGFFAMYGLCVAIFIICCLAFGDFAQGESSIFELGSKGLTIATLAEVFVLILVIFTARFFFLTDRVIKTMPVYVRLIIFSVIAIVAIVVSIFIFDWFPTDDPVAWIAFVICFVICGISSVFISWRKEKAENKKLEEALGKYKGSGEN